MTNAILLYLADIGPRQYNKLVPFSLLVDDVIEPWFQKQKREYTYEEYIREATNVLERGFQAHHISPTELTYKYSIKVKRRFYILTQKVTPENATLCD